MATDRNDVPNTTNNLINANNSLDYNFTNALSLLADNRVLAAQAANIAHAAAAAAATATATTTGAVPKTIPSRRLARIIKYQMQQQQQQQQQHYQQQQQQQHQQRHTEIVQPLQAGLKDLNDYLLTTVGNQNAIGNGNNCNQAQQQQLTTTTTSAAAAQQNNNNNNSNDNNDHLQEQQRFCYPVRPIQRVHHQQTQPQQLSQQQQLQLATTAATARYQLTNNHNNNNDSCNSTGFATNATVGVVIPTTPNTLAIYNQNNQQHTAAAAALATGTRAIQQQQQQQHQQHQQQPQQQIQTKNDILNINPLQTFNNEILGSTLIDVGVLRQQFDLLRRFLCLDDNWNNRNHSLQNLQGLQTFLNMVHEINPNTNEREVVVNSASLENVPLSEMSDNRAQSIQSIHSMLDTPTPDVAPSFDDLQQRLVTSTRNMQSIQEKQAQLLHLQNVARAHLGEMEELRQQTNKLSFSPGTSNGTGGNMQVNGVASDGGGGGDAPNYESIQDVQSDMSSLVNRMKSLTEFIHNQNELSSILGEDGPEILAEQQDLQQKLEALRAQRDDMRNLVGELQEVNRCARQTVDAARSSSDRTISAAASVEREVPVELSRNASSSNSTTLTTDSNNVREVPVEYTRFVPIEIQQKVSEAAQRAATAQEMINKKNADIEALKDHMARLKDMLHKVNVIEDNATRHVPLTTGTTTESSERTASVNGGGDDAYDYVSEHNPNATKIRMLNQVTSDLRAEAESLHRERDRISAMKQEIERRRDQAAAAVQMGEDALKRSSLTPTPTPSRQQPENTTQAERDRLKAEYELKKKEFENLCKRLEHEEQAPSVDANSTTDATPSRNEHGDYSDDDDDDCADDTNDSDFSNANKRNKHHKYYSDVRSSNTTLRRQPSTSTVIEQRASQRETSRTKNQQQQQVTPRNGANTANDDESNAAVANSTMDGISLDGVSMQSGSNRSYFMPPPMPTVCNAWAPAAAPQLPTAWNPQFFYAVPPPPPPPPASAAVVTTSMPFSTPFGTHAAPTIISHTAAPCEFMAHAYTAPSSSTSTTAATATAQPNNDPMLLQQFVQTQQMLINSICQCNQTLWHQQREIDAINTALHALQDRVNIMGGGGTAASADLNYGIRSESVPPASISAHSISSNGQYLAANANRAQSEQPLPYVSVSSLAGGACSAFGNYQQQQQQQQIYTQRQRNATMGSYNYAMDNGAGTSTTQHASSIYHAALNNAAVAAANAVAAQQQQQQHQQAAASSAQAQQQPTHFNNEAPMSPHVPQSPGPIFMHHHNNTIHQNNANLRTQNQNQHINNQQQQQSAQTTLNNQVPPGNRANNYWDNFRSYSRQNLLSHKSNEHHEQDLLQQQQQQQTTQYQLPPARRSIIYNQPATRPQQQLPQLQQQQQVYDLHHETNSMNIDTPSPNCNNLNNNNNNSKYLNITIPPLQPQQQQQAQQRPQYPTAARLNIGNDMEYHYYDNPEHHTAANGVDDLESHYRNIGGSANYRANTPTASYFNNMNLNYGNSPLFQRNKVHTKQPTMATLNQTIPPPPPPRAPRYAGYDDSSMLAGNGGGMDEDDIPLHLRYNPSMRQQFAARRMRALTLHLHDLQQNAAASHMYDNGLIGSGGGDYDLPRHGARDVATNTLSTAAAAAGASSTTAAYSPNGVEVLRHNRELSEEINRNLLVNALKSDKFTSKFYETIKEDVFRRLERLFEQQSIDQQHHQVANNNNNSLSDMDRQLNPLHKTSAAATMQLINDVGLGSGVAVAGGSGGGINHQRDPLRKLYLNQQYQLQQQEQQQQQQQQQLQQQYQHMNQQTAGAATIVGAATVTSTTQCDGETLDELHNAETESNNADDNESVLEVLQQQIDALENDEPEENVPTMNGEHAMPPDSVPRLGGYPWHKPVEIDQPTSTAVGAVASAASLPNIPDKNVSKKSKRRQRYAQQLALNYALPAPQENDEDLHENAHNVKPKDASESTPDYELIEYIIKRIRNQTHANTVINDSLLAEIAKLTTNAAQNSPSARLALNIRIMSPKRMYTKIKKLLIPRQRDEFLQWYREYLARLFVVEPTGSGPTQATLKSAQHKSSLSSSSSQHANVQKQQNNLCNNDADLAEADQNAANTNVQANQPNTSSSTATTSTTVAESSIAGRVDVPDEIENNENPEEEGGGGGGGVGGAAVEGCAMCLANEMAAPPSSST